MAIVRCDRCAARLETTQAACHKCGTLNSDFVAVADTPSARSRVGRAVAVTAVVLCGALATLRLIPLSTVAGLPAPGSIMAAREAVFGLRSTAADVVADYMKAWSRGDVEEMSSLRPRGGQAAAQDRLYTRFPMTLYSYKIHRVTADGRRADALVTASVPNIRDAVRAVGTASNPDPAVLNAAAKAALQGARREDACWMVKLTRQGHTWKILEGVDPSADEYLQPVVRLVSGGQRLPHPPEDWDAVVSTRSLLAGRNRLHAVTLSGVVENTSSHSLGPMEIVATFYDAEGTQVAQAIVRKPDLPRESFEPFRCTVVERPSAPVQRYSVEARSLY